MTANAECTMLFKQDFYPDKWSESPSVMVEAYKYDVPDSYVFEKVSVIHSYSVTDGHQHEFQVSAKDHEVIRRAIELFDALLTQFHIDMEEGK